ncbi:MAG: hypothetical protein Q7R81_04765 [Candidatus Peregrinibacteria bacterium]|nr:hypothetical protein [Candidatus Peregrinibacteria bacterium]
MSKIRLDHGHKTEGGSDIPPGDYSALDVNGKIGLQALDSKTVYLASENTARQIRNVLNKTSGVNQNTDEQRYLNHEYALALVDYYIEKVPREKKNPSYVVGKLLNIAFMNSKGWPAKDVSGDPTPTKAETIAEAKKLEALLVSLGYTPAQILEDYRKKNK